MEHNTGNSHIDGILLIASGVFGIIGELSFDEKVRTVYYTVGIISLVVLIGKNLWEWREKIVAKRNKGNKNGK